MIKVTFVSSNGDTVDVESEAGSTLLDCALEHMIPEIEGQCGGSCACATCHCYPREEWTDKLTPKGEFEEMTLV